MALSDYLTDDEWDACFYASMGQHASTNFGDSMYRTINTLLESGYEFDGLDSAGNKKQQVSSTNSSKIMIWLGNPHRVDTTRLLDNGREFLKRHLPSLVDETDDEWASMMQEAPL